MAYLAILHNEFFTKHTMLPGERYLLFNPVKVFIPALAFPSPLATLLHFIAIFFYGHNYIFTLYFRSKNSYSPCPAMLFFYGSHDLSKDN